jgi:hypothetical protein
MCTKYFADGDVHKYFNPYDSPYDSYINFMNVLDNLHSRCSRLSGGGASSPISKQNTTECSLGAGLPPLVAGGVSQNKKPPDLQPAK